MPYDSETSTKNERFLSRFFMRGKLPENQIITCFEKNHSGEDVGMGLIYTNIDLKNPRDSSLKPISVKALVDTGAITLCIPEHVVVQLKLDELEKREVKTADGEPRLVPYVGPLQVRFENRNCFTGALVLGNSVLLGSVPLEDMDLVINPRSQQVTVNPESPNIPSAVVMHLTN